MLEALQHITNEVDHYVDLAEHLREPLQVVRGSCQAVIGRRRDNRGNVAATGELDLREVLNALDGLLGQLDDAPEAIRHGQDDPVPFDLHVFPDFLDALATRDVAGSEHFAATLTWRVRSLLRDRRLELIIGNEREVDIADWLEAFVGTRDGNSSSIAVVDPRVMAVLGSLVGFSHVTVGFTNRDLIPLVGALLRAPYTSRHATYDLRRLIRKNLIVKIPHTRRYQLTTSGRRVAVLFT